MQFDRNIVQQNYTATVVYELDGNMLKFDIRQKSTTASELNAIIKKFAEDNMLDELDSNTIQLVTEELVVMVLLQTLQDGMSIQYLVKHDRVNSTVTLGIGYPGSEYNPFEQEDNIFMINIFREVIKDVKFNNPDNTFNELLLTINVSAVQRDTAPLTDVEKYAQGSTGEPVHVVRKSCVDILELMILQKGITTDELYRFIDSLLKCTDIDNRCIIFDSLPSSGGEAIKTISNVIITDLLEHFKNDIPNINFKLMYIPEHCEISLLFKYPGKAYNPFVHNFDSNNIMSISSQTSVNAMHSYINNFNQLVIAVGIY